MRLILWATTLQADILALALHLDQRDDCEILVVAENVARWKQEPIARHATLSAPVLDRGQRDTEARARAFKADVVVFDNHFPPSGLAPNLCAMWHGLGWKARADENVRAFHTKVERLTGNPPASPSPNFFAQCYHRADMDWRVNEWGLAAENCRVIGMAFTDLLRNPPYTRADVADHYDIDVLGKKTVLVSITWHYGRIFQQQWKRAGLLSRGTPVEDDLQFLEALIDVVECEGANVLLCLHDRHRYESHYLEQLHAVTDRFDSVHVKHKDEHPDNLADLLVADVMVTNLSSFITYFYNFGAPTVHICPSPSRRAEITMATMKRGKVRERKDDAHFMNEPEDNGGLTAYTAEETLEAVRRGLRDPDCCRDRAKQWLSSHIHGADGETCARFANALLELGG